MDMGMEALSEQLKLAIEQKDLINIYEILKRVLSGGAYPEESDLNGFLIQLNLLGGKLKHNKSQFRKSGSIDSEVVALLCSKVRRIVAPPPDEKSFPQQDNREKGPLRRVNTHEYLLTMAGYKKREPNR